jgi:hypothetical protein
MSAQGLFAVTGHRLGAVAVQELEHVLAVNAKRWECEEEPYYVLAVRETLALALAEEKRFRKGVGPRIAEEHGPALVAIGAALVAARSNLKCAEGCGCAGEIARWKKQVESLEGSVRRLWR